MGACGGVINLFMERFPNRPALVGGILAEECRGVLADFFVGLRDKDSQQKEKI
jgi:tRNA(adenine34) deaminase